MKKTKIIFKNPEAIKNNFETDRLQNAFCRYLNSAERQKHIHGGASNQYIHDADIANFRQRFNIT